MTALYDRIGSDYDTTRSADPVVTQQLAKHLGLTKNQHYLDIGCGTGNYTQALSNLGGQWTGLEPSQQMLQQAQEKTSSISWVLGQAEQLPFAQASFDGAIITLAIHHFEDLGQAFRQVDRVLRSGSRLVLFTVTPEQVRHFWLKRYFSRHD